MKIYMAGGVSGNLKPIWNEVSKMKLFLAGGESRHFVHEYLGDYMKIYLAGENGKKKIISTIIDAGGGMILI